MSNTIEAAVFNSAIGLTAWNTDCKLGPGTVTPTLGVFDKETASYQQLVKVQTNSPHTMRSYTIGSGPAEGYRVLLLTPEAPSRIFDLPIELREMIYGYVLIDPNAIELKFFTTPGHQRIVQKSFPDSDAARINEARDWDSRMNKWKRRNRNALSILLLNKQITAEAIKVLYGANTFRFDDGKVLKEFRYTLDLNHKTQHLRRLQLAVPNVGDLRDALPAIVRIPSLRTLQLSPPRTWLTHSDGPRNLMFTCDGLLKAAQGREAAGMISRQIEHFISALECACFGCITRRELGMSAAAVEASKLPDPDKKRLRCRRSKVAIAQHEQFWKNFRELVKTQYGADKAG
ncbi:hypothetical protein TI39_contig632g00002 [Zymoseptoria brevis]|uniref:DUF7730 domain-containing protein n=1 Tax=Zymoseptoria brevis TaxID=1047168 RepID=A0A0F4GGJ8_9PEZI|nr:hypothetical protein TI39_contig632g00002 [Zymoseptoria brevis]